MQAISILAALPDVTDGDGSAEYIRHMKESLCLLAVYSVRVSVWRERERERERKKKRERKRERAGTQKTQGWWNIKLKERKREREKKKPKKRKRERIEGRNVLDSRCASQKISAESLKDSQKSFSFYPPKKPKKHELFDTKNSFPTNKRNYYVFECTYHDSKQNAQTSLMKYPFMPYSFTIKKMFWLENQLTDKKIITEHTDQKWLICCFWKWWIRKLI